MRSGSNSVLAGLVLVFLAAHFLLLAGIVIRIVVTQWPRMLRMKASAAPKILSRPRHRSTLRRKDQEAAYDANPMQLL